MYAHVIFGLFYKSNKTCFTKSLFSDKNTWDVGKALEKVENQINFFSCSPNISCVYIREQRHSKRVLLQLKHNNVYQQQVHISVVSRIVQYYSMTVDS